VNGQKLDKIDDPSLRKAQVGLLSVPIQIAIQIAIEIAHVIANDDLILLDLVWADRDLGLVQLCPRASTQDGQACQGPIRGNRSRWLRRNE
jgi:hypothetical protein